MEQVTDRPFCAFTEGGTSLLDYRWTSTLARESKRSRNTEMGCTVVGYDWITVLGVQSTLLFCTHEKKKVLNIFVRNQSQLDAPTPESSRRGGVLVNLPFSSLFKVMV